MIFTILYVKIEVSIQENVIYQQFNYVQKSKFNCFVSNLGKSHKKAPGDIRIKLKENASDRIRTCSNLLHASAVSSKQGATGAASSRSS